MNHLQRNRLDLCLNKENQDYPPPPSLCIACLLRESERLDAEENAADQGTLTKADLLFICVILASVAAHAVLLWVRG